MFTDCDDPNIFYYLVANSNSAELYYIPKEHKEEAINRMRENIKYIESEGLASRKINPDNDIVEGE